jgi:RNA polymerase sigma-70 factor (ECF subfamily)
MYNDGYLPTSGPPEPIAATHFTRGTGKAPGGGVSSVNALILDATHGMNGPSELCTVTAELLGRLLDEHAAALALYAAQFCDAPDDCVQEALVELARQPRVPENVIAWLYRVVKHRALNTARGARRRRARETRVAEARLLTADAGTFDRFDALAAAAELNRLPAERREAVVMRIWGGLTFEQIAIALNTSKSTAQRIYRQALEQLREGLESPCLTRKLPNSPTSEKSCRPS